MRFAYDSLLDVLLCRTQLQETAAIRNEIEDILSRVFVLEKRFATPPGDVGEQRRRSELIRYVVIPPLDAMLSFFQQGQGHRKSTTVLV